MNGRVTNIERFNEAAKGQMGKCQRGHVRQRDNDDRFGGLIEYALHRPDTLSNPRFEYYARNNEQARALCAFMASFDRPPRSIHMERARKKHVRGKCICIDVSKLIFLLDFVRE